jgi:tRNA A37 threonylcarbamoyladenosine dehydratase
MSGGDDGPLSRVGNLLGEAAIRRLAAAQVTVAGLGAVGSFAVEALARSGVGHLRIIDFDCVERSNINRQLYALHSTIGRPKTMIAAERIHDIAPACHVETIEARINNENSLSILTPKPDVLVDAIDSTCDKVALICACLSHQVSVVSSMGAARRREPMAVRCGVIDEVAGCPLARNVKKGLKNAGIDSMTTGRWLRCVYSVEQAGALLDAGAGMARGLRAMGSLVCVTGVFGLVAAREALRLIVDAPETATGGASWV